MSYFVANLLSAVAVALAGAPLAAVGQDGVESYSPELKWVLRVPPGDNAVQVIDVSRGVTPLATLRARQRGKVLALRVQAESRHVWVLADNGVDVHDGFSGRLLNHWSAPRGVSLDRLEIDAGGRRVTAWSAERRYVALTGAVALIPADARLSLR